MSRDVPHSYRKYQWPTDAVTKKQFQRKMDQIGDKYSRLIDANLKLERRIIKLEEVLHEIVLLRRPKE